MLTDLSGPRETVGKNRTVGVCWPLLVGKFCQLAGRNKIGKLHKFEVFKSSRPQIVGRLRKL